MLLAPRNEVFKSEFESSHYEFIEPILRKAFIDKEEFRIVKSNIFSPHAFLLASELKKSSPDKTIISKCIEKISIEKIDFGIIDEEVLLTPIDTRGEQIQYLKSDLYQRKEFLESFLKLKNILPPEWIELVSIIKTVTLVSISGKEDLLHHFSGSDTDRWGAMHMGNNLSICNIAECLTHEASHFWMNLFELHCPNEFISEGWTRNIYLSPWRKDLRPLMGIFHGIYVFSNVYIILNYINNFYPENINRTNYIGAQVQRGFEILEENINELSENATSLLNNTKSVFEKIYLQTKEDKRIEFYNRIRNEELTKKKLNARNTH